MPVKHSCATPGEKLLALYTLLLLRGDRVISLSELAQTLDCSKQTVLRLLAQLEASGYGKLDAPIVQGREHYYRMAPMPHVRLDVGVTELAQLALCRNMLLNVLPRVAGGGGKRRSGADRGASTPDVHNLPAGIGLVYSKGRIDYAPYQQQYDRFLQAMHRRKVCIVTYRKPPKMTQRTFAFAPMRLISYGETLSLLGWEVNDHGPVQCKYDNPISLYLHRCISVTPSRRSAAALPSPPAAHEGNDVGLFGVQRGEPFHIRARFDPCAAGYVYDRQWSSHQRTEVLEDGSLILDFDAQSDVEAVAWALGFGERCTILEPQWLREEITRQARALLKAYGDE